MRFELVDHPREQVELEAPLDDGAEMLGAVAVHGRAALPAAAQRG